jgi:hypothetical protein
MSFSLVGDLGTTFAGAGRGAARWLGNVVAVIFTLDHQTKYGSR